MTRYVCAELSTDTPQTCVAWVEQVNALDQLAITPTQARALTQDIVYILGLCLCYVLLSRFANKA
jgi:hypothetical protein